MEAVDEKTYHSIVGAKVGPITAKFSFTTRLVEIVPPNHLKASGSGEEVHKAGTFTQETIVDFVQLSAEDVEVSYKSNVFVVGKLATFGDRIMKAKAKQISDEFALALNKRLSGEEVSAPKLNMGIKEMLGTYLNKNRSD